MAGIFVSYRRDDSQGFAGRLADDLIEVLGRDRVFRDIEIPIGSDFTDVLQRAISASDALLVVIGRHWAAGSEKGYESRLFEPTDWVRTEIEAAFAQGKQVIPVLVGGATMPPPASLPESIQRLTRMQAASMSDRHWDTEIRELADRLRAICPSLRQEQAPARGESPAEVLREIGGRILDEVENSRRPRVQTSSLSRSLMQQILRALGRGAKRLLSIVFGLALIYIGIRLFGDETLLGHLDGFEARLQMAWERLQLYIARLQAQ
ncbi:MAG: toll/interleukin-1 receptor domain-containing protein [Sedimenticolaceae bacterium]